jgi:hypothetical protein
MLAEWTGLEPATPGVTGRYSNRLNYHSTCAPGLLPPGASNNLPGTIAARGFPCLCRARRFLLVGAERLELPTFAL